jgi:tartrate-resistant acid phosphatase type 5
MNERIMKFLLRYVLLVWIGCLAFACSFSGLDEKSGVKDRKPIPEFSIPVRIPERNYVYFIALGDQGEGGSSQKHVAHMMNDKARKDSLHFVITLGDNFYYDGVRSNFDKQWLEKFEAMYDLPYLKTPFYPSLGNHDHRNGNARHQVEYSKKSDKWKMPHYYYTFSKAIDAHSSIQFFALDTEVIKERGEYNLEQVEWLERKLQASTATWKIVYGHHPVFSYGKHGNERRMIALVRPLLEKYEVDVYICGHDHDRQLLGPVNDVYYIVSGTGSKSRDTRYGKTTIFAETNLGFTWFRVSSSEFHVQFIGADGDVEYAHTWTKGAVPRRPYEALDKE